MTGSQVVFVAAAFVILLGVAVAAQWKWLRTGAVQTVTVFLAGVLAVVALRLAELPPEWFAGSKAGFGLAVSFLLGAWVTKAGEERAFGFPLLFGMGITLLGLNLVRAVANVM